MSDKTQERRRLRDAFGCFATGVGVVTTATPDGHQMGLTVNSFSSLSLDPPLVLWNLSLDSGLKEHFQPGAPFVVNFLAEHQQELAEKFATALEDRFKSIAYVEGEGGAPIFSDNAGFIECVTETVHPGGDHVIIVGKVLRAETKGAPPLIFHKGRFKRLNEGVD